MESSDNPQPQHLSSTSSCSMNKSDSCCSKKHAEIGNIDDPETISMVATAAILVTGFLIIAFFSGPVGLIATLILLSLLGLYYAITGNSSS